MESYVERWHREQKEKAQKERKRVSRENGYPGKAKGKQAEKGIPVETGSPTEADSLGEKEVQEDGTDARSEGQATT